MRLRSLRRCNRDLRRSYSAARSYETGIHAAAAAFVGATQVASGRRRHAFAFASPLQSRLASLLQCSSIVRDGNSHSRGGFRRSDASRERAAPSCACVRFAAAIATRVAPTVQLDRTRREFTQPRRFSWERRKSRAGGAVMRLRSLRRCNRDLRRSYSAARSYETGIHTAAAVFVGATQVASGRRRHALALASPLQSRLASLLQCSSIVRDGNSRSRGGFRGSDASRERAAPSCACARFAAAIATRVAPTRILVAALRGRLTPHASRLTPHASRLTPHAQAGSPARSARSASMHPAPAGR